VYFLTLIVVVALLGVFVVAVSHSIVVAATCTVLCLAVAAYFGWRLEAFTLRGPILAADETGMWLRRTDLSPFALHVPWAYVRRVHPKSELGKVVYVIVDPAVTWPAEGPLVRFSAALMRARGEGVVVGLAMTNTKQPWLLGELDRLSGRSLNA
jgi:hypothetical protein